MVYLGDDPHRGRGGMQEKVGKIGGIEPLDEERDARLSRLGSGPEQVLDGAGNLGLWLKLR